MSEQPIGVPVPGDEGVEGDRAGEEFLGEMGEREAGDRDFLGEHGERMHEGRENRSEERAWDEPVE